MKSFGIWLPLQTLSDEVQYQPLMQSVHMVPVYPAEEAQVQAPVSSVQAVEFPDVPVVLQSQSKRFQIADCVTL